MNNLDYGKVFEVLVKETANYVKVNNLRAMVLGISGGIDSTVVAAICHEVSKQTGILLIGRSLPIKNKSDEFATSVHVGEAFCNEFKVYRLERSYRATLFDAGDVNMANSYYLDELEEMPSRTPIANGNLQARCRMMYLYDIASRYKGLVMSTDNQTEYQLGFWTIHGDVGDFDPIQDLWAFNHKHLIEGVFHTYVDYEEIEDLDNLFAE
jgi:NAD+ synthetase